ncbi:MAG: methionine adenosyltransferase [Parcubacteria group bacterium RIFCSPLOWO2_01_FULL_48_18]|nr:MAG: methionine adenosyltransferase [Parcubacteria group bacterium RIFCSPLOWO2_01_FULL_48_18]
MDSFKREQRFIAVESVTEGHPDKICDQAADALLDAYLEQDPGSRVALEVLGSHNIFAVAGEVTSKAAVDIATVSQQLYREIGYQSTLNVITDVVQQSPDIAQGVDTGGAGDQGIMYGYASDETPEYMPRPVVLVQKLTAGLAKLRKTNERFSWLRPDGKAQITFEKDRVKTVLVSTQHDDTISIEEIKKALTEALIEPVIGDISGVEILVNPTGRFVVGGFDGDTGATGRKLMVDTYCGLVPHGGGAFSGKDPTKVDRSAAYMCRFVAKNAVANGYAKECLVSVAYAIGRAEPLMVHADTFGEKDVSQLIREKFDFRPQAIIERLNLRQPIYQKTAAYGHFGREGFSWEEVVGL